MIRTVRTLTGFPEALGTDENLIGRSGRFRALKRRSPGKEEDTVDKRDREGESLTNGSQVYIMTEFAIR